MKRKKIAAICLAGALGVASLVAFSGCDGVLSSVNYDDWSAGISTTTLKSALYIEKNSANGGAAGSGTIFYEDTTNYYALTNNHVIYKAAGETSWYTVTDCYNHTSAASVVYCDAEYDLAVVTFSKGSSETLTVTLLAEKNANIFQQLALISNPDGRHNATTFGKVRRFTQVTIDSIGAAQSNVQFAVMAHGCYSESGSSGGGIVNGNLELVGVHYACGYTEEGESVEGYAIPVEKVREFLVAAELAVDRELGV